MTAPGDIAADELRQLVQILPIGVLTFTADGTVGLRNAMASQLLMPLLGEPALDNIFFALRHLFPGLARTVTSFTATAGTIVEQQRLDGRAGPRKLTLSLNVTRLNPVTHLAVLRDITRLTDMTAFAFAGSDLLLDVDAEGVIEWAAGAFGPLLNTSPQQIIGGRLSELVAPRDREALARTFLTGTSGRIAPTLLRLANPAETRCVMAGLALAGPAKRFFITMGRPPEAEREALSGVRQGKDFEIEAAAWVRGGQAAVLGLLDVREWEKTTAGLDQSHRESLMREIGRLATDGSTEPLVIGEVAQGRFGVLGPAGTDLTRLGDALRNLVANFAPNGEARVSEGAMALDANGLTLNESVQALRIVLSRFAATGGEATDLTGGLTGILEQANEHKRDLAAIIQSGRFALLYQPVVGLEDGAVHHLESLLRPEPGPFGNTQEFVTLVEAVGLSSMLDLAVLRRAIHAAGQSGASIAVNVSGLSIADPQFTSALLTVAAAVPRGQLLIELTETAEIADLPAVAERIARLRAAGVPVCLDDFGAGSASFRYLRDLRVDMVKIDGAYVQAAVKSDQGRAFVSAMRELATSSGAETIAEMVETEAERDLMRELGVQYGQGWLFGRPAPLPVAPLPIAPAPRLKKWRY